MGREAVYSPKIGLSILLSLCLWTHHNSFSIYSPTLFGAGWSRVGYIPFPCGRLEGPGIGYFSSAGQLGSDNTPLSTLNLQQFTNYSSGVPTQALVPVAIFNPESLLLSV